MGKRDFLQSVRARLADEGFLVQPPTVESAQGARLTVDGKQVLHLCVNHSLGFTNHPRLKATAQVALERFGAGLAALRL
jgi:glycine C-acetyltransferase